MTHQIYDSLLRELKEIPELKTAETAFLSTQTRGKQILATVKFTEPYNDFDDWVISFIMPLWSGKILPLLKKYGVNGKVRFLFYEDCKMVYYTYINTTVFQQMPNAPQGDWFGDYCQGFKFIAGHADIAAVVKYLTQSRFSWI